MQKIYFENNHSLPICILGIAKHCMNNVLSCILRKYNYGICINPKKIKGQTINLSVLFDGGEVIYKPFSNKYFSVSMAARQPAAAAVIAWR